MVEMWVRSEERRKGNIRKCGVEGMKANEEVERGRGRLRKKGKK